MPDFFSPRPMAFFLLLGLAGCGHALPTLPGFDAATWRADGSACRNQRAALLPPLLAAREQLYETRANDITALLGHPDREELRANTEKVYLYFLRPGAQCQSQRATSTAPTLTLRFGPLGTVTEVLCDPL